MAYLNHHLVTLSLYEEVRISGQFLDGDQDDPMYTVECSEEPGS
jgi:hypothetical protein